MTIRPTATTPTLSAAQLRAQAPPPEAEEPSWKVDLAGAAVGGATLGAAGFYGGMEAGMALLSSRLSGPPLLALLEILALAPYYAVGGAMVGTMVGGAVGAGIGIAVARHLAKD